MTYARFTPKIVVVFLTERQKEILDFIRESQAQRGVSPTHREICERFGYSSYGTVHKHLKLLQEKGYLQRVWNQRRGLQLTARGASETAPLVGESEHGVRELPFLGLIAAGRPIEALPGHETLDVPEHLLGGDRSGRGGSTAAAVDRSAQHFVLRVVGQSMIDEGIHDGDFVVVLRRERAAPGEMVVALIDGEATLKRFFPEGEIVRLQPANAEMEPIRVAAASLEVQGVVVGLMRKF